MKFVNPPTTLEMVRFQLFSKNSAARARGLRYEWMPLAQLPRAQIRYLWASEDQRFFIHEGIDFEEIDQALKERRRPPQAARRLDDHATVRPLVVSLAGAFVVRKALEAYYTVAMERILGSGASSNST